ncbi:unnamed protein product [Protopolystoma xenopodis]|uniref:Uncharacterized protein n=1 Tax=Protopolystoma xenopodis TaxID=117903 RepID=A0A3S5BQW4_9PLAT|nr:unnamed protein product [Protopolystoma xenopodis]
MEGLRGFLYATRCVRLLCDLLLLRTSEESDSPAGLKQASPPRRRSTNLQASRLPQRTSSCSPSAWPVSEVDVAYSLGNVDLDADLTHLIPPQNFIYATVIFTLSAWAVIVRFALLTFSSLMKHLPTSRLTRVIQSVISHVNSVYTPYRLVATAFLGAIPIFILRNKVEADKI